MNLVVKLLACFLFFFLSGCLDLNKMPVTHFKVLDIKHMTCSLRKITDPQTLASVWEQDLPLEACDGVWGIDALEFKELRSWMKSDQNKGGN